MILNRMRAYNLVELFKYIIKKLDMHFLRKLLALVFGRTKNFYMTQKGFCSNRINSSAKISQTL